MQPWSENIISRGGYRAVLCLNSCVPTETISQLHLPVIAADGAANTLIKNGIIPNIVIGDMDSVSPIIMDKCRYERIADQDSTDFEKSINYLRKNNLFPAIVTGLDGGLLDHSLNNFATFSIHDGLLYLSQETIGFCSVNSCNVEIPFNTKVSILGAPRAVISTNGLKWELNNTEIDFFKYNSCSNRVASRSNLISIYISSGKILLLLHTSDVRDAGSY